MILTGERPEESTREVKSSGHREFLQATHRVLCDLSLPKQWVGSLKVGSKLPRRCLHWE